MKLGLFAFEDAFEHVTGSPPQTVPFAGRTDYEIAVDLLERSGLEPDDGLLERFGLELERAMAGRADELRARGRAYPGARECLERLGREPGVVQSLLTGNIAPNAQVKLGAFGLDTLVDLEIGAYGSDHRRRGRLVAVALQKCERKHGAKLAPRDVVLVGDTPLDVAAAREGGARAVAVATGPFGAGGAGRRRRRRRARGPARHRRRGRGRPGGLTVRSTRAAVLPINRSHEQCAERPRSLGDVIRTLFARRPDPYFGNDLDNARRLGGVMWLMYGTVAAILLPLAPPSGRYAVAAWLVAASIVVWSLLTGRHWLRHSKAGFNTLLAGSYLAVGQLATLQALAGSGASAYQELYLLLAVYTAAVHPPRRVAPFLLVLSARGLPAAALPGRDLRRPRPTWRCGSCCGSRCRRSR